MTKTIKIIGIALLLGLLFTIIDAWADSTIFQDSSFLDLLVFKVPSHEIYMRSLVAMMMIVSWLMVADLYKKAHVSSNAKIAQDEELKKLIASTSAVPWKLDVATHKFIYMGEKVSHMTGYQTEDLVDLDAWTSKIHPDDREFAIDCCRSATTNDIGREFVYRMFTADGRTIWVRDIVFVETINNKPAFRRGFFFDITKSMGIEAEKKQLEAQLRQAQKMEALGQLAGGVAHDFNNFLTAIVGYSELSMMTMQDNDPHRRNISEILSAANKAASVTRSLLAFSRKQVLKPRPININEVVSGMEKLLNSLLGDNIKLDIKLPEEDIIIKADTGQVEQIIINMAANAKGAIQDNGTFTIQVSKVFIDEKVSKNYDLAKAGDYANISFADDGAGMAEETLEKIFEPFYTTKEKDQGTGLGLAIVHGIVKQHNGSINVYSEKGCGTTFKILFPCTKSPVIVAAQQELQKIRGGDETILLAEDETTVKKLLSEILSSYGYNIIVAKDGLDAVDKFKTHREQIKLVILDVIMPGLNGKDVLAAIRQTSPDFKALFISGYTAEIIQRNGLTQKDADFLAKPILPNELLHRVREILDRAS
ncbi:MAG: ATP-binding protein [Thermodesulfobacteriota bacterium]